MGRLFYDWYYSKCFTSRNRAAFIWKLFANVSVYFTLFVLCHFEHTILCLCHIPSVWRKVYCRIIYAQFDPSRRHISIERSPRSCNNLLCMYNIMTCFRNRFRSSHHIDWYRPYMDVDILKAWTPWYKDSFSFNISFYFYLSISYLCQLHQRIIILLTKKKQISHATLWFRSSGYSHIRKISANFLNVLCFLWTLEFIANNARLEKRRRRKKTFYESQYGQQQEEKK